MITEANQTKTKTFNFLIIIPIVIGLNSTVIKFFLDNNLSDMMPSNQFKNLNMMFSRKGTSYESTVESAKKDIKLALEKLGFSDLKMLVINYELKN